MNTSRKFTKTIKEAKELFELKTNSKWDLKNNPERNGIKIFKLKIMKTKTRKFFVGTFMEWLNL